MKETLNGKVIVITGASSGFGKGAAIGFAKKGASVVLAARRHYLLEQLVDECHHIGVPALAVPTDVSSEQEMGSLTQCAISEFGHIDVWVNNAGAGAVGVFTDIPLSEHIQVIQTDLIGTIYGSYFALQQFQNQGKGTVINIASILGKIPVPYYASYIAAKHGITGLDAALRQELQEQKMKDIHVCTVLPMATNTPFFEHAANYSGRETVPIPPLNEAQEVIDVIVKLATEPKDEVAVGIGSGVILSLHNLIPAMSEGILSKVAHKYQMEDAPVAAPTIGSLRQPSPNGSEIRDQRLQ